MSGYLDMELLRFTTAGSVDDGKSTLIGRLLYDSKAIFEDQYEAIKRSSEQLPRVECRYDTTGLHELQLCRTHAQVVATI